MSIFRNMILWGADNQWLRKHGANFFFVRKAVKRFMPGEQIEDAILAAQSIQTNGLKIIFTHLGENLQGLSEAEVVAKHYIEVLKKIEKTNLQAEISLKLTQIGLDLSVEKTYGYFKAITEEALARKNFVWIDMESSAYTDVTLKFYHRARKEFENVGLCIQSYLYRTEDDLVELLKLTPAIRLVKGAYNEPKEKAYPDKKDVDENFYKLSEMLLESSKENGTRAAFATHDLDLLARIQKAAEKYEIPQESLEIQMLYGIVTKEQIRLANAGYHVRSLISYGEFWYPWYMRRLAERPANVLFVMKNMFTR